MNDDFTQRLKEAFGYATMAAIARRLGIPHATVRNYFRGRMPASDVLIKIANETNVSLNWLLIGSGEMHVAGSQPPNFAELFDQKIEEIIDRKLAGRRSEGVQDLGSVDLPPKFDIEAALARMDDPHYVMSEWFRHEGREYPQDFGVVFFQGWETYSEEEKVEAVKDAKKVLDRTLKKGFC